MTLLRSILKGIKRLYEDVSGWWDDLRRFFQDEADAGAWYGHLMNWLLDGLASVVSRIWDLLTLQADYLSVAFVVKIVVLLILVIGLFLHMAARDRGSRSTEEKDEESKEEGES